MKLNSDNDFQPHFQEPDEAECQCKTCDDIPMLEVLADLNPDRLISDVGGHACTGQKRLAVAIEGLKSKRRWSGKERPVALERRK